MLPLWLIIALPLLGFVITGLFGAKLPKPAAGAIASLAVGAAFAVVAPTAADASFAFMPNRTGPAASSVTLQAGMAAPPGARPAVSAARD